MCGRFTSTASPEELMRKFGVTILQNLRPRWNVAPSQQALVITRNGLQNEAVMAQWGLPPASAKQSFLINARAETVQEKPTFRDAFHHRRCMVVASGWYEWSAPKTPWHLQLCDGGVMAFAGLLYGQKDQQRFVIIAVPERPQLVRAPVCGTGGRRFETGHSPHHSFSLKRNQTGIMRGICPQAVIQQ